MLEGNEPGSKVRNVSLVRQAETVRDHDSGKVKAGGIPMYLASSGDGTVHSQQVSSSAEARRSSSLSLDCQLSRFPKALGGFPDSVSEACLTNHT